MATATGQIFEVYASKSKADAIILASTKPGAMCFTTDTHEIVFNGVAYSVTEVINTLTDASTNKALSAAQGKALKALIDTLTTTVNGKVNTSDIVNALTSDATNKPLSAAQGKALKSSIDNLTSSVNTKLTSVYCVMGTKASYSELMQVQNPSVGDVWNVTSEFTLSGKKYPAGTNVVCVQSYSNSASDDYWDALGGTVDLSGYLTSASAEGTYLKKSDVANVLTDTSTAKALSAAMGKKLQDEKLAKTDAENTYLKKSDGAIAGLKGALVLSDLPVSGSDGGSGLNMSGNMFGTTESLLKAAIDGKKIIVGYSKDSDKQLTPVTATYRTGGSSTTYVLTFLHKTEFSGGIYTEVVNVSVQFSNVSDATITVKTYDLTKIDTAYSTATTASSTANTAKTNADKAVSALTIK